MNVMKSIKEVLPRAAVLFLAFTLICGVFYTVIVTGVAQLIFPDKANGSIIEVDGKKYGSSLLGQQFTSETDMWGRIVKLDLSTYTDENGKAVMYASPSNLTPAGEELEDLVAERVKKIRVAHQSKGDAPIPVELVTGSGSGLDPHISVAAAEYQVERLAQSNQMTVDSVREIIKSSTTGKLLGIIGEETVNVLEVNLKLRGILD